MTNDSKQAGWPTLVATDPDDIRCPTCGEIVTGQEINQALKQAFDEIELWPGGPTYQDPGLIKRMEPDGKPIWTVVPCGHRIGRAEFTGEAAKRFKTASTFGPAREGIDPE